MSALAINGVTPVTGLAIGGSIERGIQDGVLNVGMKGMNRSGQRRDRAVAGRTECLRSMTSATIHFIRNRQHNVVGGDGSPTAITRDDAHHWIWVLIVRVIVRGNWDAFGTKPIAPGEHSARRLIGLFEQSQSHFENGDWVCPLETYFGVLEL